MYCYYTFPASAYFQGQAYESTPPPVEQDSFIAGTYYVTFVKMCYQCDAGTYQDQPGQTSCKNCPLGKIPSPGATDCIDCAAGNFLHVIFKDVEFKKIVMGVNIYTYISKYLV